MLISQIAGSSWAQIAGLHSPVSQICALIVLSSTTIERVANSTPMVDLDSRLNSFLVKRERTGRILMRQRLSIGRCAKHREESRERRVSVLKHGFGIIRNSACAVHGSADALSRPSSHAPTRGRASGRTISCCRPACRPEAKDTHGYC